MFIFGYCISYLIIELLPYFHLQHSWSVHAQVRYLCADFTVVHSCVKIKIWCALVMIVYLTLVLQEPLLILKYVLYRKDKVPTRNINRLRRMKWQTLLFICLLHQLFNHWTSVMHSLFFNIYDQFMCNCVIPEQRLHIMIKYYKNHCTYRQVAGKIDWMEKYISCSFKKNKEKEKKKDKEKKKPVISYDKDTKPGEKKGIKLF